MYHQKESIMARPQWLITLDKTEHHHTHLYKSSQKLEKALSLIREMHRSIIWFWNNFVLQKQKYLDNDLTVFSKLHS